MKLFPLCTIILILIITASCISASGENRTIYPEDQTKDQGSYQAVDRSSETSVPKKLTTEGMDSRFLKSIVSVEIMQNKTNGQAIGTAFIIETANSNSILITAKHVVFDSNRNQIIPNLGYRFNQISSSSKLFPEQDVVKQGKGSWFISQQNDVACRFIEIPENCDVYRMSESLLLPSDQILAGAPVRVLGFPLGLRATDHADPVLRSGMVARSDKNNIILDAFVFPGNSGGPVLYVPTVILKGPMLHTSSLNRERLVGVVSSYISYQDVAYSTQTQRPRVMFEENTGLCNIVPAETILALLNRADVLAMDVPRKDPNK